MEVERKKKKERKEKALTSKLGFDSFSAVFPSFVSFFIDLRSLVLKLTESEARSDGSREREKERRRRREEQKKTLD